MNVTNHFIYLGDIISRTRIDKVLIEDRISKLETLRFIMQDIYNKKNLFKT